jgi:FlaA1/EpsC-like NDP-sugar epimerase
MKQKIILIGGGGHCKSCIDVIEQEGKYTIAGVVDVKEKAGQTIMGYPFIGTDDDLP